jgi:hypothetical protein
MEQAEGLLAILYVAGVRFGFVIGMAIGRKQIEIAVIIVVKEFQAPAMRAAFSVDLAVKLRLRTKEL